MDRTGFAVVDAPSDPGHQASQLEELNETSQGIGQLSHPASGLSLTTSQYEPSDARSFGVEAGGETAGRSGG
jgi:hypothetical protein